jgi:hypothetical protein
MQPGLSGSQADGTSMVVPRRNPMARFPETEAEIIALARRIAEGLINFPQDFPSPPVTATELLARVDVVTENQLAVVESRAATRQLTATKRKSLKGLKAEMKAILRYAETAVRRQPRKLSALGWGLPRARRALSVPGEVRDIVIRKEGDTWLVLAWKAPRGGGKVALYRIQRRTSGSPWEDVATATRTRHHLIEQPRGAELEFRVIAQNRAGVGKPSATVTAVL